MSSDNCIFCKIAHGLIKADVIMDIDGIVVFRDINPKAPVHLLAIPKAHVEGIENLGPMADSMTRVVRQAAENAGIAEEGYRVVVNQGRDAGQEVPHLHFHILGGRALAWPPG